MWEDAKSNFHWGPYSETKKWLAKFKSKSGERAPDLSFRSRDVVPEAICDDYRARADTWRSVTQVTCGNGGTVLDGKFQLVHTASAMGTVLSCELCKQDNLGALLVR